MKQTKAKIFLSEERGCNEAAWFRTYHTFTFGNYRHEHKTAFEKLYGFNDNTLAAGKQITLQAPINSLLILLPVVGTIGCEKANEYIALTAGEAQLYMLAKDEVITVANSLPVETVNCLEIWIGNDNENFASVTKHEVFDIEQHNNKLCTVFSNKEVVLSLGIFDGRSEAIYDTTATGNVFAFVLDGAFEVQNRLLHAKDGLALWNVKEVEFEALSNKAIILLLELQ